MRQIRAASNPFGQGPFQGIDNDLNTKLLEFNKGSLVIDFGKQTTIDSYSWSTAEDHEERGALSWTLDGSDDGVNWVELSTITDYPTPLARRTYLSPDFLIKSIAPPPTSSPTLSPTTSPTTAPTPALRTAAPSTATAGPVDALDDNEDALHSAADKQRRRVALGVGIGVPLLLIVTGGCLGDVRRPRQCGGGCLGCHPCFIR